MTKEEEIEVYKLLMSDNPDDFELANLILETEKHELPFMVIPMLEEKFPTTEFKKKGYRILKYKRFFSSFKFEIIDVTDPT